MLELDQESTGVSKLELAEILREVAEAIGNNRPEYVYYIASYLESIHEKVIGNDQERK